MFKVYRFIPESPSLALTGQRYPRLAIASLVRIGQSGALVVSNNDI
jgi:hypothetical protein